MQGKILAEGIIRGKDGKRYTYELDDIQGCDSPPLADSEVDFEVKDGKAVDIIVTKQPFNVNKLFIFKKTHTKTNNYVAFYFGYTYIWFNIAICFSW